MLTQYYVYWLIDKNIRKKYSGELKISPFMTSVKNENILFFEVGWKEMQRSGISLLTPIFTMFFLITITRYLYFLPKKNCLISTGSHMAKKIKICAFQRTEMHKLKFSCVYSLIVNKKKIFVIKLYSIFVLLSMK